MYVYIFLSLGITSINQQWEKEIGNNWVMGKGLVTLEQYRKSRVLNPNIFEYKQIVRASVMWMSFNEHIQFNDVMFQQLNALMSTDDNQPKGNQTIKINNFCSTKFIQGGSCFYWGGSHFKMFDGSTFSLSPGCGHVLVTEPRNNMIKISTR